MIGGGGGSKHRRAHPKTDTTNGKVLLKERSPSNPCAPPNFNLDHAPVKLANACMTRSRHFLVNGKITALGGCWQE